MEESDRSKSLMRVAVLEEPVSPKSMSAEAEWSLDTRDGDEGENSQNRPNLLISYLYRQTPAASPNQNPKRSPHLEDSTLGKREVSTDKPVPQPEQKLITEEEYNKAVTDLEMMKDR